MRTNMHVLKTLVCGVILLTAGLSKANGQNAGEERMQWWNEQKFGMFVHFGPFAHNADRSARSAKRRKPAKKKEEAIRLFNPAPDSAEQWARLAKEAGMRYVVFTSKHTHSFTFPMWATKTTNYGITFPDSPYSKQTNPDFVAQYVKAIRGAGLGVGLYYPWDDNEHPDGQWFNAPDRGYGYVPNFIKKYPGRWENFVKFQREQLRELCTQYGPIDIFWFDGGYPERSEDVLPTLKMMRELQPQLILNNRGTQRMADIKTTAESGIPANPSDGLVWETCMGVAGKGAWVPNTMVGNPTYLTVREGFMDYQGPEMEYKDARALIQSLCTVASRGG